MIGAESSEELNGHAVCCGQGHGHCALRLEPGGGNITLEDPHGLPSVALPKGGFRDLARKAWHCKEGNVIGERGCTDVWVLWRCGVSTLRRGVALRLVHFFQIMGVLKGKHPRHGADNDTFECNGWMRGL